MDLRGWDVRIVAMGAAVAVLAGCGGDPEPVVTPTPTETVAQSPSPTPSPSPTELTEEEILAAIPEVARTEDFFGAQAFAEFFISEFPKLFGEPYDGRLFRALSDLDCVFCNDALENSLVARDTGASTRGGDFTFHWQVAQGGKQQSGAWLVEQRFSVTDTEYLDSEGSVTRTSQGGNGLVVARLIYLDEHWAVDEIAFEFDDE